MARHRKIRNFPCCANITNKVAATIFETARTARTKGRTNFSKGVREEKDKSHNRVGDHITCKLYSNTRKSPLCNCLHR